MEIAQLLLDNRRAVIALCLGIYVIITWVDERRKLIGRAPFILQAVRFFVYWTAAILLIVEGIHLLELIFRDGRAFTGGAQFFLGLLLLTFIRAPLVMSRIAIANALRPHHNQRPMDAVPTEPVYQIHFDTEKVDKTKDVLSRDEALTLFDNELTEVPAAKRFTILPALQLALMRSRYDYLIIIIGASKRPTARIGIMSERKKGWLFKRRRIMAYTLLYRETELARDCIKNFYDMPTADFVNFLIEHDAREHSLLTPPPHRRRTAT